MTQVMDPTVKIWPGSGKAMELEKVTIYFTMNLAHTHTLPSMPLLTKYVWQSTEGYAHGGR